MPHIVVPEHTFQRLAARAADLNITIDELVQPALDQLVENGLPAPQFYLPLTGDAWLAEFNAWKRDAESRAGRYPVGFALDDSRETMYRERENAQT